MQPTVHVLPDGRTEYRGEDTHHRRQIATAPNACWTPTGWCAGTTVWTRHPRDGWDSHDEFEGHDPTTYATYAECQAAIDASLSMRVAA